MSFSGSFPRAHFAAFFCLILSVVLVPPATAQQVLVQNGTTDGSATLSDPVRIARGAGAELQLEEAYPNPARQRVTVRFAVPESQASEGEATLRLYDVLGRELRSAAPGAEAGRHETQLSVEDLASGTYFLRLTVGGQAVTHKLTVVR